jgi:dihydrofolate reductase
VTLVLIAALDRHRAIGRDNALPWHLPADLKRFKVLTLGHSVLMGRKTAESIGRALPGRRNLVLTRSTRAPFEGQEAVASIDAACRMIAPDDALMVIGGGEVYALALPHAQRLHLTLVDTSIGNADAFFPEFDPRHWREIAREAHPVDAKHAFGFEFVDYERVA